MISKAFSEFSEFSLCFVVFVSTQAVGNLCGGYVRGLWKRPLGIARKVQPRELADHEIDFQTSVEIALSRNGPSTHVYTDVPHRHLHVEQHVHAHMQWRSFS